MKTQIGLWIDHRKATIVTMTAQGEEIEQITSKVEKHPQRATDASPKGPYEAQQVPADDSQQRAFTGHLNKYYDAVIEAIDNAEEIFILGPGEAKTELKKRIEEKSHGEHKRNVVVEAADKMTNPQIAAKVRDHFAK
jgi:stalled ribosome rescue protein Dom34